MHELDLPYITANLTGVGGRIKDEPGHFVVEEIPLYEPCGQGDHVYLRLAREGLTTRDLVLSLADLFGLKETDVGCAGQKDKQARTVQTFSLYLPRTDAAEAAQRAGAELPVEVVSVSRHTNKLKTGHLLGNRFTIVLADPAPGAIETAKTIAKTLAEKGLPNYFGEQRFGREGDNAAKGLEALEGRGPKDRWTRRFLLSAFQSHLFNAWLAERIGRGWFDQLLMGDVAKKTDTGGLFLVEDEAAERPRFEAREITYTGPIYGAKMKEAQDQPGRLEQEILDRFEIIPAKLKKAGLDGSRRPARLYLPEIPITPHDQGLLLQFDLPKGSYATTLLREFTKTP
ncbi:MAG: tRNA pseudouridine(13) synthase TruD [Thermodesulfobacteriota bacterium]